MKRFVVALALLLGIYGLAQAESAYVIIIYNLSVPKEKNPGPNQPGGFPGMPGGIGGMIPPGGAAGAGGMVPPGGMGGVRPPGGMGGVAPPGGGPGMGWSVPPGGVGGGAVPPGGMGGVAPPGGGAGGMVPPGGAAGAGGMVPPGGVQPPSGFGGGSMPPQPGMGGGMGGMGIGGMGIGGMGIGGMGIGGFFQGGNGGQPKQEFTPLLAIAVVEVEHVKVLPGTGGVVHVTHKWSPRHGSYILPVTLDKKITATILDKRVSVHARYDAQYKDAHKDNKPTPDGLYQLAEWALKHDLLDEFVTVMGELAAKDPKHEAVLAFQQVEKEIAKPITKGDASDVWRTKVLDGYKVEKSAPHYALLHNLDAARPVEVTNRLARLESNYRAFYYWFALRGKVLPVPDQRLVVVLVKLTDEFKRQQQIFESLPSVSDGFLARRDNLAIFSLARTDAASEALAKNTKSLWDQLTTDRDTTLKDWPKGVDRVKLNLGPGAEMQTIALLERALQDDAEIAAVTHEGTRQLLAATGQLPRNVAVPEWLQFGWASFFETPKGSPWMTVGTPSSTLLPEFNYLGQYKAAAKANKLEKQRHVMLLKVITDAYFHEFARNPKSEDARLKARTLSWALTYFLANKKLDGLISYQEHLKKLPRDLEFDPETLQLTFAKAFDCLNAANPNVVDPAKLDKLANQWHDYIMLASTESEQLFTEMAKAQAELKSSKTLPKPSDAPAPR